MRELRDNEGFIAQHMQVLPAAGLCQRAVCPCIGHVPSVWFRWRRDFAVWDVEGKGRRCHEQRRGSASDTQAGVFSAGCLIVLPTALGSSR